MVRKARRLLGVSALSLLTCLWFFGCSGEQQTEEGVEVSEQGEQGAEEGANSAQGNNAAEGADNMAQGEPTNGATEGEAAAGAEAVPAAGGTENDLQEIIQEMNGQPAPNGAGAAPLAQNMAPQNQAAPAPAPAAEAAGPAPQGSAPIPFQPGGSPAGQGLPELGSKMAYIVEKGDTLGKISQKIFGSPGRWKELADLSGITNPSRIFPGDLVYYTLEEGAVSFAQTYEATPRSEETVQPGDTLATIAKRVYGTTTAWRSLWRQNDRIDNPDIVPPGTTVYYLPMSAAVAANQKHSTNNLVQINKKSSTKSVHNLKLTKTNLNNKNSNVNTAISTLSQNNSQQEQINSTNLEASFTEANKANFDQTFLEANHKLI